MRCCFFFGFLLVFSIKNAFAQLQLGARLDNWAGTNALSLNPTAGVNAATGWSVNVVGLNGFVANDIIFVEKASVLSVLTHPLNVAPNPRLNWFKPKEILYYFNFFNETTTKFYSIKAAAALPALQINLENGQSFSTIWNFRVAMGSQNIPALADAYVAAAVPLLQKTFIEPFKTGGMVWQEYGLNYAFSVGDPLDNLLSFGISAKRLIGHQAFFLQNNGTWYTRWTKDSTQFHNLDLLAGFTDNILDKPAAKNGGGWGIDVGVQYTIGSGEWDEKPYQMRFSAALLDFGKLNFRKNAQVHRLKTSERLISFKQEDYKDIRQTDPIPDAINRINNDLYGTKGASLNGNEFSIALPTALIVQADVAVTPQYFANILFHQRLPANNRFVQADNVLAVTPRFESPLWTVSMPFSLSEWQRFQVGLAARFAYLTVGTDNLAGLFGKQRLTSGDLYMSLIINPLHDGKLGKKRRNGLSLPRRGGQKCYRF